MGCARFLQTVHKLVLSVAVDMPDEAVSQTLEQVDEATRSDTRTVADMEAEIGVTTSATGQSAEALTHQEAAALARSQSKAPRKLPLSQLKQLKRDTYLRFKKVLYAKGEAAARKESERFLHWLQSNSHTRAFSKYYQRFALRIEEWSHGFRHTNMQLASVNTTVRET